ncbi:hypothetical protein D3C76_902840 [compost metagenome]
MTEGTLSNTPVVLDDTEVVARALFTPEWDERVKRGSPGCFKRNNTSVTRHAGLTFTQVVAYLKGDVEKPDKDVIVRGVGLISVKDVRSLGKTYQDPVHFDVISKPTPKNPAHAEVVPFTEPERTTIKRDVSRGLSSKISQALDIYVLAPDGSVEEHSPPVLPRS